MQSDNILSGKKISLKPFILQVFYFSIQSLTNLDIAALTVLSDQTVGEWRKVLLNSVAIWFYSNSTPISDPGKIVEIYEAKFGKGKFHRRACGCWVVLIRKLASALFFPVPTTRGMAGIAPSSQTPGPSSTLPPTPPDYQPPSPPSATQPSTTPAAQWNLSQGNLSC